MAERRRMRHRVLREIAMPITSNQRLVSLCAHPPPAKSTQPAMSVRSRCQKHDIDPFAVAIQLWKSQTSVMPDQ